MAQAFSKDHKYVLRKTRSVISQYSTEFAELNFTLCDENNELQNSKPQPFYQMTRDGWKILMFGFTGKAAMTFKEAFIAAFNWMADMIRQGVANLEAEQNAAVLQFMKEKDVASMTARLLNRWGKVKKPQLLAQIKLIEQLGLIIIPELPK